MNGTHFNASGRLGWWTAVAAAVVGLAYAAISAYWGLGGTWLLATVGASLATGNHDAGMLAAAWAAVALKAAGAAIPLLAGRRVPPSEWHHRVRMLAWVEGAVLILYGFVLTAAGLLVQAGVLQPGRNADRRALAWHAYLWDPWFLLWGLLVAAALVLTRPPGRCR